MAELVIIADDLTGALDAAAPFAARGIATQVALSLDALPRLMAGGASIVSVSTGSREMSPDAARAAARQALVAVGPGVRLLKKVDSRLKGNIEAELDAFAFDRALVVPAIPEFGRVSRAGHIEGFGVVDPIDIGSRLGHHAARSIIPDAASRADIAAALRLPHDLSVGARGLAEAMADQMAPGVVGGAPALPSAPAFCVVGSTDPITLAQLQHLRATHPDLRCVEAPNGVARAEARDGRLTVLQAVPGPVAADADTVAAALGQSLLRLAPPDDTILVVSGGATAQRVLAALGIDVLDLVGEALPGLPMARANGLTVITKSGGFGSADSLSRLFAPQFSVRSAAHSHVG